MKRIALAFALGLCSASVLAESADCTQKNPAPEQVAATMSRAQQLKTELDSQPESVVVLVRQGQNMAARNLTWSHAGFALRQPNGDWRIVHNLNACGTAESSLFIQGLYEFLADDLVRQDIAILRPRADLEAPLAEVLHSPVKLNLFHSARYNLIAWPFAGPYQNSNGWLLEVFARANNPQIWSRNDARQWLQQQGYQPSIVSASSMEKLGAKLFASNVFTDDQPEALLREGKVGLNSGDSVMRFISNYSRPIKTCEHQGWGENVCIFQPKNAH